jgi:Mlc titration factor MtfA (ptsG expression regulator)
MTGIPIMKLDKLSKQNWTISTEKLPMLREIWQEQLLQLRKQLRRRLRPKELLKLNLSTIDSSRSLLNLLKESVNLKSSFLNSKDGWLMNQITKVIKLRWKLSRKS